MVRTSVILLAGNPLKRTFRGGDKGTRVRDDAIHDCKAQVTVSWNFLKGADTVPHASPCRIERQFPP